MKSPGYFATILFLHFSLCYGIKVDKVYLYDETPWVGSSPVHVFCDVTTEGAEEVMEVQWWLHDQLVYQWLNDENNTITVSGLLEDRVELPKNRSDWNLKINRIVLELEGNFSCLVISDENTTDNGVLPFIINYAPEVNKREWSSDCRALATLHYPRIYPRPIVAICNMEHKPTNLILKLETQIEETRNLDGTWSFSFQTSAQISSYPEGSYMRCFRYLYGVEIDMINWVPEEETSCPALNPVPSHPDYYLFGQQITPACRTGVMADSSLEYMCTDNMRIFFNTTCQESGTWSVDLYQDENWPPCTPSLGARKIWKYNLLIILIFMNLSL